jgi:DNA repair exonuclease SbcCD ATPase subunit
MSSTYGPERAEVIRVLQEQIREAKARLESIAATADSEETSFHLRDEADLAYGELSRETKALEDAMEKLGQGSDEDDVRLMQEVLEDLRRDVASPDGP